MHSAARQLTPEEQQLAKQFAARAAGAQVVVQQQQQRGGPPPSYSAAAVMQPASSPTTSQQQPQQAHILARAAQMMAAAQQQQQQQRPQHPAHAAAAMNAEIGKAFVAAGRPDLLPYLAPRPNNNNNNAAQASAAAAQASAAAAQQKQQQGQGGAPDLTAAHQAAATAHLKAQNHQQQLQQQQQYTHQDSQRQANKKITSILSRAQSAPRSSSDDQVPEFDRDERDPPLQVPAAGAPLPSMSNLQLTEIPTSLIHPNDVLCGRGGGTNNHPGNERFRDLVTAQKVLYLHSSKRDKPSVSRGIVRAVRNQNPPGRFLHKDEKIGMWYDIGDQKAREKTSQALREGAPEIRREITNTLGRPPRQSLIPPIAFAYGGVPGVSPYPNMSVVGAPGAAAPSPGATGPYTSIQQQHSVAQQAAAAQAAAQHAAQQAAAQRQAVHVVQQAAAQQSMPRKNVVYEQHMRDQRVMAIAARQMAAAAQQQQQNNTVVRQQQQQQPFIARGIPKPVVPTTATMMGRGRGTRASSMGILGGDKLAPRPFGGGPGLVGGIGVPRSQSITVPTVTSTVVPSVTAAAARSPSFASKNVVVAAKAASGRANNNNKISRRKDAPTAAPLPHDCARRLVLAETVAQKTVNGTITDELKSEEYRIGLYMDAGLLGILPSELVVALTQGRTESEVVEEKYEQALLLVGNNNNNKRKRDEILPPCRRVPKTKGALEALGALTMRGIDEALIAVGASTITTG